MYMSWAVHSGTNLLVLACTVVRLEQTNQTYNPPLGAIMEVRSSVVRMKHDMGINRRGRQITRARANNKGSRNPEGRKNGAESHLMRVIKRGKVASKRATTAERQARYDLKDYRLNGFI